MAIKISPLAHVDPRAEIDDGVEIGPFCSVGPNVRLETGCKLDSHVVITGHTTVGRNNRFFPNAVIGADPQDYSYSGGHTCVAIGDNNIFREGVTVHRAAEKEDHVTRIGNNCFLMSNAHVAHNCKLSDNVVLVNGVLLGGHVHVHDGAIISGNTVVHHFATVGMLGFVSGGSRVTTDVPPFMLHQGCDAPTLKTVNIVGMQRRGIPAATIALIKQAFRLLVRESMPSEKARVVLTEQLASQEMPAELAMLLDFMDAIRLGSMGRGGEVRRQAPSVPPVADEQRRIRRAA